MSEINDKVENLNRSFLLFKEGLVLLREHAYQTETIKTLIWKLEKALIAVNQELLKELDKDITNDKFKNIIKDF